LSNINATIFTSFNYFCLVKLAIELAKSKNLAIIRNVDMTIKKDNSKEINYEI